MLQKTNSTKTINRTIVELKLSRSNWSDILNETINRTIVELKLK